MLDSCFRACLIVLALGILQVGCAAPAQPPVQSTSTQQPTQLYGDYLFGPTEPPADVELVTSDEAIGGVIERDQSLKTATSVTATLGYADNLEVPFNQATPFAPLDQLRAHPGLVWLLQFEGVSIPRRGGRGGLPPALVTWYVLVDANTGVQLVGFTDPARQASAL